MNTIQEIEVAVAQLPPQQLADFDAWYAGFKARYWGVRMEADGATGCLDILAAEALQDYHTAWQQLAISSLARACGNDEPEYSAADLKHPNPGYAGS